MRVRRQLRLRRRTGGRRPRRPSPVGGPAATPPGSCPAPPGQGHRPRRGRSPARDAGRSPPTRRPTRGRTAGSSGTSGTGWRGSPCGRTRSVPAPPGAVEHQVDGSDPLGTSLDLGVGGLLPEGHPDQLLGPSVGLGVLVEEERRPVPTRATGLHRGRVVTGEGDGGGKHRVAAGPKLTTRIRSPRGAVPFPYRSGNRRSKARAASACIPGITWK